LEFTAYQVIIAAMPPHDVYIEAFLGSGAVMRRKPAAIRSIGIDLDSSLLDASLYPDVELHCTDAPGYIDGYDYAGSGRVLIYADPPYLLQTRTSSARYRHEFTEADHVRLIATLKRVPANVILSGYPSALYNDLLADWRTFQFQAMTRGGVRTEQLWFNFEPCAAYWSSYAGKDFTDRQRIKRKAERWARNYAELPPDERQAILAAILATDSA